MKSLGLLVTNAIKTAGLIVGLFAPHGGFSSHPEAAILGLGGFMMAGAQLSEQTVVSILQRLFGQQEGGLGPEKSGAEKNE